MSVLTALPPLYRLLGPHRKLFWLTLALGLAAGAWSVVTFLSASALIQSVFDVTQLRTTGLGERPLLGRLYRLLDGFSKEQRVMLGLAMTAGSLVVGSAIRLGALAVNTEFLARFMVHAQTACLGRMLAYRLSFHDETRRSQLSQLVVVEARSCYTVSKELTTLAGNAFAVVVPLAFMVTISPLLTLAFGAVGFAGWLVTSRWNRLTKRWSKAGLAERNELMAVTQEALYGIKPVKLLDAAGRLQARFAAHSAASVRAFGRSGILVSAQAALVQLFGLLGVTIVIAASVWDPARLAPAAVILFLFVAVQIIAPFSASARAWGVLHENLPAVSAVVSFLGLEGRERERDGHRAGTELLRSRIVFDGVVLDYESRPAVLAGIDLEIRRGERIGIVGPSGSGKTSLVNLLPRLYDPREGRILVDGVDLREFRLDFLRSRIGLLSQDVFVFNASVRDNIRMGRPTATEAEVHAAARRAHAHEFIVGLPQGYDTVVGDRGVKLSGGQRQRVNIAQVFLRAPEILILDEATSALDSDAEALVQDAIDALSRDRTVIVVAHRLSTLRAVDRVVVLDGGRIVEQGAPDDLLRAEGVFARMWEVQASAIG